MQFTYVAYNLGQGVVKGRVEGRTLAEAQIAVIQNGLKLIRIAPAKRLPSREEMFPSFFRVGTMELVRFSRQMATMLASGADLLRIVQMLHAETRNKVMRRTLEAMKRSLDEGDSLSEAMSQHPTVFNSLLVSVVQVGEYTGRLGPALEQMADILEKEHEIRQKAIRTMMYPTAIMGLSLLTLAVLMTVALPPLLKVFDQMKADVPLMTRIAIGSVNIVKGEYLKILLSFGALLAGLVVLLRFPRMKFLLTRAQLRVPFLGSLIIAGELARFSRTTAMLLEAGVSLSTALKLGVSSCKNGVLRQAFVEAEEALLSGRRLTEALKRCPALPPLFVELVMIGEESNSLRRTMRDAADTYQKQVDQRLNALLAMLEPASTVIVGAIVGFIAFSMFVPIYAGLDAIK
ncbi:MAG: type II secretion system F family protein [Chloroflexi bacterium]|nr:type II secretion system F family protein [Chloroflexota bacterium]